MILRNYNIHEMRRFNKKSAFSLIEIMVSLAIVSVIVLLVGNIFDQASDSWHAGMGSSEVNNSARAAMDLMATELTQAFAGKIEHAAIPGASDNITFIQHSADKIEFFCLNKTMTNSLRGIGWVCYFLDGTRLKRYIKSKDFNPYKGDTPNDTGHDLLPNVAAFNIKIYKDDLTPYTDSMPFSTNALPACADIFIELVPDSVAETLASMSHGAAYDNYRAAHVKSFSTRVYFRNRMGFRPR